MEFLLNLILDGSIHYITPEKSIQIQHNLGADIIFAFDECTSPAEDLRYQEEALERTHRWAERSLSEHLKLENQKKARSQVLEFAGIPIPARPSPKIVMIFLKRFLALCKAGRDEIFAKNQQNFYRAKWRSEGTRFDGFGIGGSFAKEDMSTAVKWVNEILPEDKPRHLLGIGEPEDLFMGVENGVDLFDCVAPTRLGRNGTIYTKNGKIIIMNTTISAMIFLRLKKIVNVILAKTILKRLRCASFPWQRNARRHSRINSQFIFYREFCKKYSAINFG